MAQIIPFDSLKDPDEMTREELLTRLGQLREQIAELDEREPSDMNSEEYELWGERHEELEDLLDDVLDRLEAFGE